jgi:predicted RNA methylase
MEACSFQNWYLLFKDLTVQSVIIPVCNNVVSYLLEDSTLVLPEEVYNSSTPVYSDHEGDCLDLDNTEETSPEIKVKLQIMFSSTF